jgi:hypothetical protein
LCFKILAILAHSSLITALYYKAQECGKDENPYVSVTFSYWSVLNLLIGIVVPSLIMVAYGKSIKTTRDPERR